MDTKLLSVGIDIGTFTTNVIFSHIHIMDVAGNGQMPHAEIVDKKIIYRSPVHYTPLRSETEIDVDAVTDIVRGEYEKAGVIPASVQTGAVIITGDTARKSNAEQLLGRISQLAGDFVVATAGPELESILAGKGSGAENYSKEHIETISNVDIGGGTANIATFYDGVVTDADCLDVGGRLLRFVHGTRRVAHVYPKLKKMASAWGVTLEQGREVSATEIRTVTDHMAGAILAKYTDVRSADFLELCTRKDVPHRQVQTDVVSFSGGVGDLVYQEHLPDAFKYDDIGVFLAQSIRRELERTGVKAVRPAETIGATVVGAGSHSVVISGSTVSVDRGELPVQNLPILKIKNTQALSAEEFARQTRDGIRWIQGKESGQNVALAVEWEGSIHFEDVSRLSGMILAGAEELLAQQNLLVVLVKDNFGKVLGHSIRRRLPQGKRLLCLDSVNVENGDYIDIGNSIEGSDALPIVIKTLAFAY